MDNSLQRSNSLYSPEIVNLTDPYLDPANVYARADGTVVAAGPHGEEFPLTDSQRATVDAIETGLQLPYAEQIALHFSRHSTRGVPHP